MTKEKWIALAITVVAVIGSLGLIKIYPFWATLSCLVSFILGVTASYYYKKGATKNTVEITEAPKETVTTKATVTKTSKASKKTV